MKYKGMELEEITEPQIFDPPKKMLVWNEGYDEPVISKVWSIAPPFGKKHFPVFTTFSSTFEHCAEIPEEPKPRRATNRELARWLAQGNGEINISDIPGLESTGMYHQYMESRRDEECADSNKVRKWDDTDWHEPTVDYMGLEGK